MQKAFLFILLLSLNLLNAQVQNNGALYIGKNSFMYLDSTELSFGNNGSISTDRTNPVGRLVLGSNGSMNVGIFSNEQYVDGYLERVISNEIIFPVGQGLTFTPLSLIPKNEATFGTIAFLEDPTIEFGNQIDTNIIAVSTSFYYEINGDSAKIRIGWNTADFLNELLISDTDFLKICGFNTLKNEWEFLSSTIDTFSLFNSASSTQSGSITTSDFVYLSDFSAFSLCKAKHACIKPSTSPELTPNQTFEIGIQLLDVLFESGNIEWYTSLEDAQLNLNPLTETTEIQENITYFAVNRENSCASEVVSFTFTLSNTANVYTIQTEYHISCFPNPTNDIINITSSHSFKSYLLLDQVGALIQSGKFNSSIDVSSLTRGVYTLILVDDTHRFEHKIIKL